MNIEQPTSPPDIDEPTAYYRDQARERAILEALSENRRVVEARIIEALTECMNEEERRLADAIYAHARDRLDGSSGQRETLGFIGGVITKIVDDYIMSIPRWQDRVEDLAWEAWDDDRGAV